MFCHSFAPTEFCPGLTGCGPDTALEAYCRGRTGLLADVTQQLSNMKIFIHALNSRQERGSGNAIISATISINGLPQLQNIIERLGKIPGVISIDRS